MNDSVKAMMESYFESIPKGRGIAIEGYGTFTVDELRDAVRQETPVGNDIKRAVVRHNRYKEQLARRRAKPTRGRAKAMAQEP